MVAVPDASNWMWKQASHVASEHLEVVMVLVQSRRGAQATVAVPDASNWMRKQASHVAS
jgi:hypothetical protein